MQLINFDYKASQITIHYGKVPWIIYTQIKCYEMTFLKSVNFTTKKRL